MKAEKLYLAIRTALRNKDYPTVFVLLDVAQNQLGIDVRPYLAYCRDIANEDRDREKIEQKLDFLDKMS